MSGEVSGYSARVVVQTCSAEGVPVTTVRGEVDHCAEDAVHDEVTSQLRQHPTVLVVDLRQVTFLGSSGLKVLLESHTKAERAGTRLAIVADQRVVLRPLLITKLDRVLRVHPDVAAALAAVAPGGAQG